MSDIRDPVVAAPTAYPSGSVCAHKRWPDRVHADACWTTPRALCDIDAPIHPDDITRDDAKVTCPDCLDTLEAIRGF